MDLKLNVLSAQLCGIGGIQTVVRPPPSLPRTLRLTELKPSKALSRHSDPTSSRVCQKQSTLALRPPTPGLPDSSDDFTPRISHTVLLGDRLDPLHSLVT